MENKFKVGDRVVVRKFKDTPHVAYESTLMDIYNGKSGTIKSIDYSDHSVLVDLKSDRFWYPIDSLELINTPLAPDIHTDIQSLKDKYPQFNITVSVEEKENG